MHSRLPRGVRPHLEGESPSSTRLEALVPSRDSRARTRSPSPLGWEDPWEEGTATHSVILLGALAVCQATSQDHKDKGLVFKGVYKALSQCHPNRRKRRARTRPPPPPRPECVVPGVGWGQAGEPPRFAVKPFQMGRLTSMDDISGLPCSLMIVRLNQW